VDETKSRFRAYYYDQAREIYPSNWVTFNPGGAVEAFGKKFKSGEEYYSYADDLRRRTNHYLFSWVDSPGEVPLVVDQRRDNRNSEESDDGTYYPCFLIALQNDGPRQIVFNRIVFTVEAYVRTAGIGESARLDPLAYYDVEIFPSPGNYSVNLVPPVKIAADDSASLGLRVTGDWAGYVLVCYITLIWRMAASPRQNFLWDTNNL
jgi:hypothetical protein